MQERAKKTTDKSTSPQHEETSQTASALAKRGQDLQEQIDELLDEIDDVLEENAEEFVANYVQRGGE